MQPYDDTAGRSGDVAQAASASAAAALAIRRKDLERSLALAWPSRRLSVHIHCQFTV
jgi:hypothetical protein